MKKIAILVTGLPPPKVGQVYGNYDVLFTQLFQHLYEATSFLVLENQFPENYDFDAFLITEHGAYEDLPWIHRLKEFIRNCPKKIIGICFGHQIIAEAFGGKVEKNPKGWEVGLITMNLSEQGKKFFGQDTLVLQQMHADYVSITPPGFEILAFNEKCPNHSMMNANCLTFQGHPEYTPEIVQEFVKMRLENGVFTQEMVQTIQTSGPSDQKLILKKIFEFLE